MGGVAKKKVGSSTKFFASCCAKWPHGPERWEPKSSHQSKGVGKRSVSLHYSFGRGGEKAGTRLGRARGSSRGTLGLLGLDPLAHQERFSGGIGCSNEVVGGKGGKNTEPKNGGGVKRVKIRKKTKKLLIEKKKGVAIRGGFPQQNPRNQKKKTKTQTKLHKAFEKTKKIQHPTKPTRKTEKIGHPHKSFKTEWEKDQVYPWRKEKDGQNKKGVSATNPTLGGFLWRLKKWGGGKLEGLVKKKKTY